MVYPNSADKTLLTDPSRSAAQDASLDRGLHSKLSMPNGSIRAAAKRSCHSLSSTSIVDTTRIVMNRFFAILASVFLLRAARGYPQGPLSAPARRRLSALRNQGEVFLVDLNHDGHLDLVYQAHC